MVIRYGSFSSRHIASILFYFIGLDWIATLTKLLFCHSNNCSFYHYYVLASKNRSRELCFVYCQPTAKWCRKCKENTTYRCLLYETIKVWCLECSAVVTYLLYSIELYHTRIETWKMYFSTNQFILSTVDCLSVKKPSLFTNMYSTVQH